MRSFSLLFLGLACALASAGCSSAATDSADSAGSAVSAPPASKQESYVVTVTPAAYGPEICAMGTGPSGKCVYTVAKADGKPLASYNLAGSTLEIVAPRCVPGGVSDTCMDFTSGLVGFEYKFFSNGAYVGGNGSWVDDAPRPDQGVFLPADCGIAPYPEKDRCKPLTTTVKVPGDKAIDTIQLIFTPSVWRDAGWATFPSSR